MLDLYRGALNRLVFSTGEQRALLIPAAAQGDQGRLQVSEEPPRWLQIESVEAASFEALGSTGFPPANNPFVLQDKGVMWKKN